MALHDRPEGSALGSYHYVIEVEAEGGVTAEQLDAARAMEDVRHGKAGPVPRQLQNKHFDGEDAAVKGQNYLYPHDFPHHWTRQQYLPDGLKDTVYYEYGENKNEQAAKEYWAKIKR